MAAGDESVGSFAAVAGTALAHLPNRMRCLVSIVDDIAICLALTCWPLTTAGMAVRWGVAFAVGQSGRAKAAAVCPAIDNPQSYPPRKQSIAARAVLAPAIAG